MIALEFIGTITEDAQISTTADNKKEITFPVDVKRGIDKNGLDKSIVIYCKKKGICSSDKRLVRDQKIFIRGDINASLKRVCTGVNRAVIEEDSEEEKEEDEPWPMETMDKEAYEIKKDGMTRAERRVYKRMLAKQKNKNTKQ